MRKIIISILVLLLLPIIAQAADELTFNGDTNITVAGTTIVVKNGSICDQMVVNAGNVVFTMSANSQITITSSAKKNLTNTLGVSTTCGSTESSVNLPGQTTAADVTVTPSGECGGSGPTTTPSAGGGAVTTPAPSMPSTTTGEVTATASAGGKTTLTTDEAVKASVELPANAVSASTVVKIETKAKASITDSRPAPSGRQVVGSYVYDYTATASGASVTNFDKDITLTFTYTDEQISGLNESTLRIYYWKESTSQWVALSTIVNSATNTLTVTTNHLTYFAVLGRDLEAEGEEQIIEEGVIYDGDLIRNPNAEGMAQFDIYIVKLINSKKFKRLILSPHVFESYEHFDKNGNGSPWDDVQDVAQGVMDQYTNSDLVRAVGDQKVYKLTPTGDTGTKQWLNMTYEQFVAEAYDSDSIYEINATDRNAYTTGADLVVEGAVGQTIIIKTANLRVRSLPSLDGEELTMVHQNEVYDLLDEQNGWYKITANGETGWCYGGDTGGYAAKQ